MRTRMRILGATVITSVAAAAVPILASSDADAARFTIDNVVVYRVGSGAALSNAAAPVFLDEYDQTGTKVQSIALPTAAVRNSQSRQSSAGRAPLRHASACA